MDRVPSDHPSIETVRGTVERHGGARRRIEVPAKILPDEQTIRLVTEETVRFAAITPEDGCITGVFDAARQADAAGSEESRLEEWLDRHDRSVGDSILLDIITPEYAFGLRAPGERVTYPALESPDSSLDAIARSLDEESR